MARRPNRAQSPIHISDEQVRGLISKRAEEICLKRGCAPGNDWADWFEAEKQVKKELHM